MKKKKEALSEIARATFKNELKRSIATGVRDSAVTTFLLLIAVRHFEASSLAKGMLVASHSFGMLFSPLLVIFAERHQLKSSAIAGSLFIISALGYAVSIINDSLPMYLFGCGLGVLAYSICLPLFTQIYQENYPDKIRGRLFSRSIGLTVFTSICFSWFAGQILSHDFNLFPWILLIYSLSSLYSSSLIFQIPTKKLSRSGSSAFIRGWNSVKQDSLFRNTLISWMFLGFGNFMILPLRVEYLTDPKYGFSFSAYDIAFYCAIIPQVARIIMSQVWGTLFDKVNFFILRIILNISFILGTICFFLGDSIVGLWLGSICYGVANAGGDIAWTLWVTKFAPHGRVAEYMSVHTFFTGIRGVLAPIVAFQLINHFSLAQTGIISVILMFIACLLLIPEIRRGKINSYEPEIQQT